MGLDDGRAGVEFTGMISAPAGDDPLDVLSEVRDAIREVLRRNGNGRELEDIGLWLSDDDTGEDKSAHA